MAVHEAVINPPTRGAGRMIDVVYPAPQNFALGAGAASSTAVSRQTFSQFTWGAVVNFGAPPAPQWVMYRGRIAFHFTGNGVSGGAWTSDNTGTLNISFPLNKLASRFNNDFRCWRVMAILANDTGLGSGDFGLEVGPQMQGNYSIFSGNFPGFRVGPSSDTTAKFQVRQSDGGPLTIDQTIATGINTLDWNAYELRFIGATDKLDAVVKCFLNGRQVAVQSYGAGTLLPPFARGTTAGFGVGLGNRGGTGAYVPLCGLQIAAGPTEDSLL